jgi:hypothetical protein
LPCGHGGPLPAVRLTKRSSGRHFTRMYAFGVPLDRDAAQLPHYIPLLFASLYLKKFHLTFSFLLLKVFKK